MTMKDRRPAYAALILLALLSIVPVSHSENAMTPTKHYKKAYRFTQDTFTDKVEAWTKILAEYAGKPNVHYLEIGTFEGRSALWVLDNILTHPTSSMTVIDAFGEHNYPTFAANLELSGAADRVRILPGQSTEKIREVPLDSVDLSYIDGSGRGIIMLSDLISTWHLTKVGGMIICSRYSLNDHLRRVLQLRVGDPGPHEAIDTFVKMFKPYINVVAFQGNYVVVRKLRQ